MFLAACPSVISETRLPNLSVLTLSLWLVVSGAMCRNIITLACPDRESASSCVSFEFLHTLSNVSTHGAIPTQSAKQGNERSFQVGRVFGRDEECVPEGDMLGLAGKRRHDITDR